jgi:hypothetical protein
VHVESTHNLPVQPHASDIKQVFISYSRNNREACLALRSALEQAGFSVFQDEDAIRIGTVGSRVWKTPCSAAPPSCCCWGAMGAALGRGGGAEVQVALYHFATNTI